MTGRGLCIPRGDSFANKSVLLSKKQIVNILVYGYLNVKWFNLPQWNEIFHEESPRGKISGPEYTCWDKARVLQETDKSDPASAQEVWIKIPEN